MDKSQLSRLRLSQELQSSTVILGSIFCRLFKELVQKLCTDLFGDIFGIASWRSFNKSVEECFGEFSSSRLETSKRGVVFHRCP